MATYDPNAPYGYSAKGTPLRADGSPVNFAGNKAAYDRYLSYEDELSKSNLAWNTGPNGRFETLKNTGVDIGPNPNAAAIKAGSNSGGAYSSMNSAYASAAAQARAAQEAAAAENQRRINAAIAAVEAQRGGLQNQASDAKREAYQSYMLSAKNAPEIMASAGLSGGIAESTAGDLYRNYETSRAGVDRNLMDANRQIDTDINTIRAQGDATAAGIDKDYSMWLANALMQAQTQQRQLDQQNEHFWANNTLAYDQLDAQRIAQAAKTTTGSTKTSDAANADYAQARADLNDVINSGGNGLAWLNEIEPFLYRLTAEQLSDIRRRALQSFVPDIPQTSR